MKHCCIGRLRIGSTHPVWNTVDSNLMDVRRAITKSRVLTGTYTLQAHKCKFSKVLIQSTCQMCYIEDEDIHHMLLRCPALATARQEPLERLKRMVFSAVGQAVWERDFRDRDTLVKLIVDSGTYQHPVYCRMISCSWTSWNQPPDICVTNFIVKDLLY